MHLLLCSEGHHVRYLYQFFPLFGTPIFVARTAIFGFNVAAWAVIAIVTIFAVAIFATILAITF